MDRINQLSNGDKLISGGAGLMLVASFFDWYHLSIAGFGSAGYGGWGAPGSIWSVLAILLSLGMAGIVFAIKFGNVKMPDLPQGWTWPKAGAAAAGALVVLMILKAWRITAVPVGGFGVGFFLAVIATVAIAAGGYLLYTEEKAGGAAAR